MVIKTNLRLSVKSIWLTMLWQTKIWPKDINPTDIRPTNIRLTDIRPTNIWLTDIWPTNNWSIYIYLKERSIMHLIIRPTIYRVFYSVLSAKCLSVVWFSTERHRANFMLDEAINVKYRSMLLYNGILIWRIPKKV